MKTTSKIKVNMGGQDYFIWLESFELFGGGEGVQVCTESAGGTPLVELNIFSDGDVGLVPNGNLRTRPMRLID